MEALPYLNKPFQHKQDGDTIQVCLSPHTRRTYKTRRPPWANPTNNPPIHPLTQPTFTPPTKRASQLTGQSPAEAICLGTLTENDRSSRLSQSCVLYMAPMLKHSSTPALERRKSHGDRSRRGKQNALTAHHTGLIPTTITTTSASRRENKIWHQVQRKAKARKATVAVVACVPSQP